MNYLGALTSYQKIIVKEINQKINDGTTITELIKFSNSDKLSALETKFCPFMNASFGITFRWKLLK